MGPEKIPIVAQNASPQLLANQDHLLLPVELVDVLNNAYFLHLLATDPAQVLPPGKSLLSVMARTHTTVDIDAKPTLKSRVEDIVHKAFWDEATSTLSNPEPSAQLSRIKLLYADLHVALSPLLPPKHLVLLTLSSPLSPTSSPLDSVLVHLREVLTSLRQRCAPIRDPEFEVLQRSLDDPLVRPSHPAELASLVSETIRNVLKLSEIMKDDLSQFILGSMTEQQLSSVVVKQAKTTEREIVINLWGRDRNMQQWMSWVDKTQPPAHLGSISAEPRLLWIVRIVQALGSSSPVSCPLPSKTIQTAPAASSTLDGNGKEIIESGETGVDTLPPVFFFSAPTLLKIQNYLQALVIAASLGILAQSPAPSRHSHARSGSFDPDSFMFRIWTLLRAEIAGESDTGDTKLINLADEVIRARTQVNATSSALLSEEEETGLRAAVDRTIRYEGQVYKLLQCRLLTELSSVLVKHRQGDASRNTRGEAGPVTLRTGRDVERPGKRPRLVLDLEDLDESTTSSRSSTRIVATDVKGFEDPVLIQAIVEVFQQVDTCLRWVGSVWGDVVDTGNVRDTPDGSLKKSI